jgi:hypothetical protein
MKSLTVLILIGFVSLAVFGFAGMLESAHASEYCIASLAQNGACPPQEHTVASALFHTNALKVFSTTLVTGLALAALMFFARIAASFILQLPHRVRTTAEKIGESIAGYRALRKLRFALARLEHSPTSS